MSTIIHSLLTGSNYPLPEKYEFKSTDHIRYQNGIDVSGHNKGCNRKIVIEKNIIGNEGYTVTIYNLDNIHPFWGNNIQMSPKQMIIISAENSTIKMRGFGTDAMGASFSNYGIDIMIEEEIISQIILNMFDRNIAIKYLP